MMELLHQFYLPAPAADVKTVCISWVPQAGATLPPYGHLLQQGLCPVQVWHVSTVSIKTLFPEETQCSGTSACIAPTNTAPASKLGTESRRWARSPAARGKCGDSHLDFPRFRSLLQVLIFWAVCYQQYQSLR